MVKHTQTIRRLLPTNCLSVLDHFVELALKGLIQSLSEQADKFSKFVRKIFNILNVLKFGRANFRRSHIIEPPPLRTFQKLGHLEGVRNCLLERGE